MVKPAYSPCLQAPWQDIVRSMHPLNAKERWLAVLHAYFDEGGDDCARDIMSFSTVVAPFEAWQEFELKWKRRLRRAGLDIEKESFHANRYFGRWKPFDGYKWEDSSFRSAFFSDLVTFIDQTVSYVAINAVIVKDWHSTIGPILNKHEKQRACYVWLMTKCLEDISKRVKDKIPNERVACIFDRNEKIESYARHIFYELKEKQEHIREIFEGADWKDKREFVPLQAADLFAYEGYQAALEYEFTKSGAPRESFRRLFQCLDQSDRLEPISKLLTR
jgi:hypothetical protein